MAYCEYCGSDLTNSRQFCDGCGAPIPMVAAPQAGPENQTSQTTETVEEVFGSWGQATAAGLGASLLGSLLRGTIRSSMRRPAMPPHGGVFHGHGTPGHRGGFGGPGRGPGGPRGGFGGPGGPCGRRGGPR